MMRVVIFALLPLAAALQTQQEVAQDQMSPSDWMTLGINSVTHSLHAKAPIVPDRIKVDPARIFLFRSIGVAGIIVFFLISAVVFYNCLWEQFTPQRAAGGSPNDVEGDFTSGVFECHKDTNICCLGTFCLPILWSNNMRLVGYMSFWTGIALFVGLGWGLVFIGLGHLTITCIMLYFRSQLRNDFNMDRSAQSCCFDCLAIFFCRWCVGCQEARHIKAAHECQHPMAKQAILKDDEKSFA